MSNSDHNVINGNSINNNLHFGLLLNQSSYNNIMGNRFIDNGIGCGASNGICVENRHVDNICEFNYLNYFTGSLGISNLIFIAIIPMIVIVFYMQIRKYKINQER